MEHKEWIIRKIFEPQEIVEFIDSVFDLVEIRAIVGKLNGISFVVHSNEQNHNIPHVHAQYGEYEISIAIESGEVLAGNIPPQNLKRAVKWVKKNKEKLLSAWKDYALSANSSTTKSLIGVDWK